MLRIANIQIGLETDEQGEVALYFLKAQRYRETDLPQMRIIGLNQKGLSELLSPAISGFEMPREYKAVWLDLLRHGGLWQAKGQLCMVENGVRRYCCLGVYCDLVRKVEAIDLNEALVKEDGVARQLSFQSDVCANQQGTMMLPSELEPEVPLCLQNLLAKMNDGGWSFAQIADVIEIML